MRGRKPKKKPANAPDWSTAAARVCWLLETRFNGNRRALAEASGVSHTAIINIANGQQPGRRVMEAMTQHLKISPAWLLNGEGEPFTEREKQRGLPIARKMLPGSPSDFSDLLLGDWIDDAATLFTPSQYWLLLTKDQPILRDPHRGFRSGDLLLLETDRTKFPRESQLANHLCVARFNEQGTETHKLGVVNFFPATEEDGPQRLEIDCFDLEVDPTVVGTQNVYSHFADGTVKHTTRMFKTVQWRSGDREVPVDPFESEPILPKIRYADVVSVWLRHLRRPASTPL